MIGKKDFLDMNITKVVATEINVSMKTIRNFDQVVYTKKWQK